MEIHYLCMGGSDDLCHKYDNVIRFGKEVKTHLRISKEEQSLENKSEQWTKRESFLFSLWRYSPLRATEATARLSLSSVTHS